MGIKSLKWRELVRKSNPTHLQRQMMVTGSAH